MERELEEDKKWGGGMWYEESEGKKSAKDRVKWQCRIKVANPP